MQRARFNTQIEGWLAQKHVFVYLDPVSWALARAVCKDWHALLERIPLRLTYLLNYRFIQSGDVIERYTWFPFRQFRFKLVQYVTQTLLLHENLASVAALLLRIGPSLIRNFPSEDDDGFYTESIIQDVFVNPFSGGPRSYSLILSPFLMANRWRTHYFFWNAMGMGNTRLLDWLIESRWVILDQKGGEELAQRDKPEHFILESYKRSIDHLSKNYKVPDIFWLELVDYFCTKKHLEEDPLLPIIEQTGVFPSDWCETILNNKRLHAHSIVYEPFHNKIRHICGCAVKKQKK